VNADALHVKNASVGTVIIGADNRFTTSNGLAVAEQRLIGLATFVGTPPVFCGTRNDSDVHAVSVEPGA